MFLDDLISLEKYVGEDNAKKGRQFTTKVYDYILRMIQIFPFTNPKFIMDSDIIRRGIYDKNYRFV